MTYLLLRSAEFVVGGDHLDANRAIHACMHNEGSYWLIQTVSHVRTFDVFMNPNITNNTVDEWNNLP